MMCFTRKVSKYITFSFKALNIYSNSSIVYLLYDKDLAFRYALLSNDTIRPGDDNIHKKIRMVPVENVNCF